MPASPEFIAAWHAETERLRRLQETDPAAGLGLRPAPGDSHLAPVRRGGVTPPPATRPWEGTVVPKPWQYRVTAAVVHLDAPDLLAAVVATLRAQTERPYLLVIDSGSLPEHREVLRRWDRESDDLELIELNPKAWRFTSEPVAVAMDCAFARCQTEFLYGTHTDVFLKRPDYLEYLTGLCGPLAPAVGYQMSPRSHAWHDDGWARLLSHTATLYHMPSMRKYHARWSMTATFERWGVEPRQPPGTRVDDMPLHPDTEVELGLCLRDAGVGFRWVTDPPGDAPAVVALGPERNEPYETEWLEHVRCTTGHRLYDPDSARAHADRLARARAAALARAARWRPLPPPGPERADLLAKVAACPDRGPVLPVGLQPECRCAELSECRAGRGAVPGRVALGDCLQCRAELDDLKSVH